ncbi:MAG: YitT family protein [Alkalibacterium sp.]|nr:YitT family protein [Alkalibacterium sp.]
MFIGEWDPVTREPLLAALFGGGITGFRDRHRFPCKIFDGGTSIIVQILYQFLHLQLGLSTILVDGVVILIALLAFNVETVMFSLIASVHCLQNDRHGTAWIQPEQECLHHFR